MDADQGFSPDIAAWEAWSPAEVTARLAAADVPWSIVGGWALDLFRGELTREHGDLEIAVPADRFDAIHQCLKEFEFFVPGDGVVRPLDTAREAFFDYHQTWVREPSAGRWRLDVMRDPNVGDVWVCRRNRHIRRPYEQVICRTTDGIPYVAPEIALLFKGKGTRPKDEADFAGVHPLLSDEQRAWLIEALTLAYGGDHRWIRELDARDLGGAAQVIPT